MEKRDETTCNYSKSDRVEKYFDYEKQDCEVYFGK